MALIEVRGLTKKYAFGKVRGIEDMEFTVEEGELFGFIGPNGAGKSTTIRILMNFIHADSGTAKIGGLNCRTRSRDIKRFTGYMPSEVRLYPNASVREILEYACRLRGDSRDIWRGMAEYFELDHTKQFRELSMGNRRKLSIIQAMMSKPRLLILDEPTGGLDPIMQEKFFAALTNARAEGATVFFSSHNLGEVQKYCSRVALVKDGSIRMMPDSGTLGLRYVEITSAYCGDIPEALGASDIRRTEGGVSFMLPAENLNRLAKMLSGLPVDDIVIEKPSLEQHFHKIYRGEDTAE